MTLHSSCSRVSLLDHLALHESEGNEHFLFSKFAGNEEGKGRRCRIE